MKILFRMLALFLLLTLSSCQSTGEADSVETQIILVRHAEKAKGKNPDLTEKGKARAQALVGLSETYDISAVLSSDYKRTRQTAQPLASHLNLEVNTDFSPVDFESMLSFVLKNHKGKTVFIAGHSNTVPAFASHVSSAKKFQQIDESDFNKLFLIKMKGESKKVQVFEQAVGPKGQLILAPKSL